MSEISKNELVTRRGFIQRGADAAKLLTLGAALGTGKGGALAANTAGANPWAYDDANYRKTDPKLIRYKEVKRFNSSRLSPRCIALGADNKLFIGAGNFVTEHTPDGSILAERTVSSEVRCLAVANDGMVYVGMRERVEMYNDAARQTLPDRPRR
jgi:hypothetical protein